MTRNSRPNRPLRIALLAGFAALWGGCGGEEAVARTPECGGPVHEGCYSPCQNLDAAYDEGARGCTCNPGEDRDVCVADSRGRNVALVCAEDGTWIAVEDGPCLP